MSFAATALKPSLLLTMVVIGSFSCELASGTDTDPAVGLRENPPRTFALVGAKIVISPEQSIERGLIVIRDGLIETVSADVAAPPGTLAFDLAGKTIYAGFIDALGPFTAESATAGLGYWSRQVAPQVKVAESLKGDPELAQVLRGQGFTAHVVAPEGRVIAGQSALVLTAEGSPGELVVNDSVALHMNLSAPRERTGEYPTSVMGTAALARQAFYDAQWYKRALDDARAGTGRPRPDSNVALASLAGYLDGTNLVIASAADEIFAQRAYQVAREFSLRMALVGSGREYTRLDLIQRMRCAVILPVDFPKPPDVASVGGALDASLEELMHWRLAPENPGRLANAGVPIAFTTNGLKDRNAFLGRLRRAVRRGLSATAALAALTTTPAKLFGEEARMGTIEAGKLANLVVVDGDLVNDKSKIVAVWVRGKQYEIKPTPIGSFADDWILEAESKIGAGQHFTLSIKPGDKNPNASISSILQSKEKIHAPIKAITFKEFHFTGSFDGSEFQLPGKVVVTATVLKDDAQATLSGHMLLPDGTHVAFSGKRRKDTSGRAENAAANSTDGQPAPKPNASPDEPLAIDVNYPLGDFGRLAPPDQEDVAFTNATVWTCGPRGVMEGATVLIRDGVIAEVRQGVEVPNSVATVDATGKHISPGIIDCHSHIAIDGPKNESGQAITAEVRVVDAFNPNDINIYRQLAGGVTTVNVLHGSTNVIGGQNQVMKLRWGATTDEMKFDGAPPGIKFALGENVKLRNSGSSNDRYPQTRMGVDELMKDEFQAALDYRARHERWRNDRIGQLPRRDLELEAILEILEGKRLVHCHCYRQSEIIALLRTFEQFGIKVATLQHVLEGYKITPEIAAHGAMASAFTDRWSYKFETYDAIPYNGTLMHRAGIVVSYNSDDFELARHLNQEAAKATKYGNVSPEEALQFVTLNPAKQLRIEKYVGSIEPGKHADLVLWSGPPLSTYSRCEQTWVDGREYFDIEEDQEVRKRDSALRARLVQSVLNSGETSAKSDRSRLDPESMCTDCNDESLQ